jgi:uncharacterized protein DUF2752
MPPIRSSGRRALRGDLVLVLRRGYSAPENITIFAAGAAAVGTIYPTLMIYTHEHGIPCPLRTLTGVPCPFCGLTTATVALVHGQWQAATATSPLVYLVAALAAATAPVLVARALGLAGPPRPWSAAARRRTGWIVAVVAALSWLYQLHRFGFL